MRHEPPPFRQAGGRHNAEPCASLGELDSVIVPFSQDTSNPQENLSYKFDRLCMRIDANGPLVSADLAPFQSHVAAGLNADLPRPVDHDVRALDSDLAATLESDRSAATLERHF